MRIFEEFNQAGGVVCPICKTNKIEKTVLIQILGTTRDNIAEAMQVHLECLDLKILRDADGATDGGVIFQTICRPVPEERNDG